MNQRRSNSAKLERRRSPRAAAAASYAVLVLITIIWGSTFLLTRQALRLTHPFTFLAMRFSIASLLLGVLFCGRLRGLTRTELLQGVGLGVILFLALALQTVGAPLTTAGKAGFLVGLSIPAAPLFAIPLLRQTPGRFACAGIALSFIGTGLISMNGSRTLSLGVGEWMMIAAAAATALHIVAVGRFAPSADPIRLTVVQISVTAGLSALAWRIHGEPAHLPANGAVMLAGMMGLFATAFTLAAMARVQRTVSSTRATLIYALEPVWAAMFGALAGETLKSMALAGCGLVLVGIVVGSLAPSTRHG